MTAEMELLKRQGDEDSFDTDLVYGLAMGTMLFGMVMLIVPASIPATSAQPRVPVLTEAIEPIAGNAGMMWLQITPAGLPNELRMIAENSTGAFEAMLLGLST